MANSNEEKKERQLQMLTKLDHALLRQVGLVRSGVILPQEWMEKIQDCINQVNAMNARVIQACYPFHEKLPFSEGGAP